jgi:hypothetical protein
MPTANVRLAAVAQEKDCSIAQWPRLWRNRDLEQ